MAFCECAAQKVVVLLLVLLGWTLVAMVVDYDAEEAAERAWARPEHKYNSTSNSSIVIIDNSNNDNSANRGTSRSELHNGTDVHAVTLTDADQADSYLEKLEDLQQLEELEYLPIPEPMKGIDFANTKIDFQRLGLLCHVQTWSEGMANWRHGLGRTIHRCHNKLNATFIEPCIEHGRLKSCAETTKPQTAVRLSQVYDLTLLQRMGVRFMTYNDFVKITKYKPTKNRYDPINRPNHFVTCRHTKKPEKAKCAGSGGILDKNWSPAVDAAKNGTTVILDMGELCKNCLGRNAPDYADYMTLRKEYEEFVVSTVLPRAGIGPGTPWGAIQFRGEGAKNFDDCANYILHSRDLMCEKHGLDKNKFFLISPISPEEDLMWGGAADSSKRSHGAANAAISKLMNAGFKKMEFIYPGKVKDEILLYVFDLVIAKLSTAFTSCKGCNKKVCKDCGHMGFSVGYGFSVRRSRFRSNGDFNNYTESCYASGNSTWT